MSQNTVSESRTIGALSLLYVFRMLGLFMVFPIMMTYGADYEDATPFLLGAALGIYGITQAVFQLPLGLLSDVWGRKPVIALGLLVFALGSFVAAGADDVWGLIIGRALQGAGAIASAVMALVSDLTSDENRTKAMAIIGVSIGVSFSLAMVLGPVLSSHGGLQAVFWVSCGLAFLGILVLIWLVPSAPLPAMNPGASFPYFFSLVSKALSNKELLRLDFGIFALHFVLTAAFVMVPFMLLETGLQADKHWSFYLPVMVAAFVLMLPFMYLSERKKKLKAVFLGAIAVLVVSQAALSLVGSLTSLVVCLLVFFAAFNLLEATLPSLVSKVASAGNKGTAMGVYSTSQFLGAALGGLVGGHVYQTWGVEGVSVVVSCLCFAWLLFAATMTAPKNLRSLCFKQILPVVESELQRSVPGIKEVVWEEKASLLYLKVDDTVFDRQHLTDYLTKEGAEPVELS